MITSKASYAAQQLVRLNLVGACCAAAVRIAAKALGNTLVVPPIAALLPGISANARRISLVLPRIALRVPRISLVPPRIASHLLGICALLPRICSNLLSMWEECKNNSASRRSVEETGIFFE